MRSKSGRAARWAGDATNVTPKGARMDILRHAAEDIKGVPFDGEDQKKSWWIVLPFLVLPLAAILEAVLR